MVGKLGGHESIQGGLKDNNEGAGKAKEGIKVLTKEGIDEIAGELNTNTEQKIQGQYAGYDYYTTNGDYVAAGELREALSAYLYPNDYSYSGAVIFIPKED